MHGECCTEFSGECATLCVLCGAAGDTECCPREVACAPPPESLLLRSTRVGGSMVTHIHTGQSGGDRTGAGEDVSGGSGCASLWNVALPAAVSISHRCRSSPMLTAAARGDWLAGTGPFGATGVSTAGDVEWASVGLAT